MTFKAGLKASHDYLIATADDFKQMADHLNSQYHRSPNEIKNGEILTEKYQLLYGQAAHILKLNPPAKKRRPF